MADENSEVVVVDPPMPTAENPGTSPIESLMPAVASVETPAAEIESSVETPAEETETVDEVAALSEQFGYDLSRFKDKDSAMAAMSLIAEQFANFGLATDYWDADGEEPQEGVDETPAPVVQDELELDETAIDPALAKTIKTLYAQNKAFQKQLSDNEIAKKSQAKELVAKTKKELEQRAFNRLSAVNPTAFGEPGKRRTPLQEVAARNAWGVTKLLINGMAKAGRQTAAPIESVVDWALQYSGQTPAAADMTAKPKQKGFSLPPKKPAGGGGSGPIILPRVSAANDPFGHFKDEKVRAIWREALQ